MLTRDLLLDAFERIRDDVHGAVADLSADQLSYRVEGRSNSIAWLVWHLTRIQDGHIADVARRDQVWTSQGWTQRFGLPFEDSATGYGQHPDDAAAVRVDSPDLLTGYFEAVHAVTGTYLNTLADADLDRVVDTSWDPPVTLGARLVSVLHDDMQHAGQAALIRGVVPGG